MWSENVLTKNNTEALCLTRGLSIRMTRYTLSIVMNCFRSREAGLEVFRSETSLSLLSIVIPELTSFSWSVKINVKWATRLELMLCLLEPLQTHCCRRFLRNLQLLQDFWGKLRSVLHSLYQSEDESDFLYALFGDALKRFSYRSDQPDNLMRLAPHVRFESTCPCQKTQGDYAVKEPSAVRLVPVITSTLRISSSLVKIGIFLGGLFPVRFVVPIWRSAQLWEDLVVMLCHNH